MSAARPQPPPIRAERIAAFARRDPAAIQAPDIPAVIAAMREWEESRDFLVGPRVGPPGGRMMGTGLGFLLCHPEPAPFWDPEYRAGMIERTRVACGFTEREAAAVALLEALEDDAIRWQFEREREWRLRDRGHRRRYGGTPDFQARRKEFIERHGARRPRDFWQQAVLRLRDEGGLRPKEIMALAEAFRRWSWRWQACADAVEIALRRAKTLPRNGLRP